MKLVEFGNAPSAEHCVDGAGPKSATAISYQQLSAVRVCPSLPLVVVVLRVMTVGGGGVKLRRGNNDCSGAEVAALSAGRDRVGNLVPRQLP